MLEEAERAGARILKPAKDTFWGGYSGYFADPDGHPTVIRVASTAGDVALVQLGG